MTAQVPEVLYYDNQKLSMCSVPLMDYFTLANIEPKFRVDCTALWRGYVGTWEIIDGRLYLIGIEGHFENGNEVNLSSIFPEFPDRVFAHWYSGKIRAPRGELIDYVHGGFASVYEQDIIFKVKKGMIVDTKIKNNEAQPNDYESDDLEDIF